MKKNEVERNPSSVEATPENIRNLGDMLRILEQDATAIKNGLYAPEKAQPLTRIRTLQVKLFDIFFKSVSFGKGRLTMPMLGTGEDEPSSEKKPN